MNEVTNLEFPPEVHGISPPRPLPGPKFAEMAELFRAVGFQKGPIATPDHGGTHTYSVDALYSTDARTLFLSIIALKATAANLPDQSLFNAAGQSLADLEDEYCGTPPRPVPTLSMAVSLASLANSLQAGPLQAAIRSEASQLAQKAFAATPAIQPATAAASAGSR